MAAIQEQEQDPVIIQLFLETFQKHKTNNKQSTPSPNQHQNKKHSVMSVGTNQQPTAAPPPVLLSVEEEEQALIAEMKKKQQKQNLSCTIPSFIAFILLGAIWGSAFSFSTCFHLKLTKFHNTFHINNNFLRQTFDDFSDVICTAKQTRKCSHPFSDL